MLKGAILLLCFGLLQLANAQIISSTKTLDYGKVSVWNNDTLSITIENRKNTVVKLLPTYHPSVQLIGPQEIGPKQSVTYKIVAYPKVSGSFEFKELYFFSNVNEPIVIEVKGYVKKFNESALFNCPKLENEAKPFVTPEITIKILDAVSKQTIYHAESEFSNPMNSLKLEGGFHKVFTLNGNYRLNTIAEGYENNNTSFLFDKKKQEWIVYMVPIVAEELVEIITDEAFITLEDVNEPETKDTISSDKSKIMEGIFTRVKKEKQLDSVPSSLNKEVNEEKESIDEVLVDTKTKDPVIAATVLTLENNYKKSNLPPQHIIILADVSYSMKRGGYIDALKTAMQELIKALRPEDSLTILTFSTSNIVLADHQSAKEKDSLFMAIEQITARGGTNAKIGLKAAYGVANRYKNSANSTQIFLFTDGKFSSPGTNRDWYAQYVEAQFAPKGYQLNMLLFSKDETDYAFLSEISDKTGGKTRYVSEGLSNQMLQLLMK